MTDSSARAVRVLHLVSTGGVTGPAQQGLFMPMLTRMPKQRVKMLAISLSPNAIPGAVLRQNGIPVYDVELSKKRFSFGAFKQLLRTVRAFRPDVIQAWGHTAQLVSIWLRKRYEEPLKLVWTVTDTVPLARKAGLIDRQKLKYASKFSNSADRIVYASEASASAYRRVGFPDDGGHTVIPLGVDPTRFKPDFAARRKVREQLGIEGDAFVIGMVAPFQPEYDFPTLFKAVGELIKTNPNLHVLLAGHGVQKGNGPLMALVGGGTLGTRTQLLGEWSDLATFFNACDLACSSALTDAGRMSLVIAMLCGVPCVATGMGAQGEVIGQFGVAVEPGSPAALIRGITRILQLPQDKRVFMAQGARKHALSNFVSIRSLQKYLQIYYDLVGRTLTAATAVPVPEIDATIPVPSAAEKAALNAPAKPKKNRTVDMYDLADPDSLESRDAPAAREKPKAHEGDVLQIFETTMAKTTAASPNNERARGVAEELEDLLAPEALQSEADKAQGAKAAVAKADVPIQLQPTAKRDAPIQLQPVPPANVEAPIQLHPVKPANASVETSKQAATTAAVAAEAEELSLADTMTIFTLAEPKPTKATSADHASAPAVVPEPQIPAIAFDPNATAPGIAVDALLSASSTQTTVVATPESLQLDFLSDTAAPVKQVAS